MTKFGVKSVRPNVTAPIRTTGSAMPTREDGWGYERDAKSELFLLAPANLVREDTFYELAPDRYSRFVELVHRVTRADADWIAVRAVRRVDRRGLRHAAGAGGDAGRVLAILK
jgi:hypothetical protein